LGSLDPLTSIDESTNGSWEYYLNANETCLEVLESKDTLNSPDQTTVVLSETEKAPDTAVSFDIHGKYGKKFSEQEFMHTNSSTSSNSGIY